MAARARILAFGAAGLLVIAGVLCAGLVSGLTGEVLAIALISAGLGGALLLMFLDVGLSEDRQRARSDGAGAARDELVTRRQAPSTGPPAAGAQGGCGCPSEIVGVDQVALEVSGA